MLNFLSQVPTERPEDLLTFQWILIGLLVSVAIYFYKAREKCGKEKEDLVVQMFNSLSDVNESLKGVASLVEAMQEQYSLRDAIEMLARERDHDKNR